MLSEQGRDELEKMAQASSACLLMLHIPELQSQLLVLQGPQGLHELDLAQAPMSVLLDTLGPITHPDAQATLLAVAHKLSDMAIGIRQEGKYDVAYLYYRFALATTLQYQHWEGLSSVTWNIWLLKEDLKELLRFKVAPPVAEGVGPGTLTLTSMLAGAMLAGGAPPATPTEKFCRLMLSWLEEDATQLLPLVKAIFAQFLGSTAQPANLQVLQALRRIVDESRAVEVRRQILQELWSAAVQLDQYDVALCAIVEELAQANEYDLFVDGNEVVHAYHKAADDPANAETLTIHFTDVWDQYLQARTQIATVADTKYLLQVYPYAQQQFHAHRVQATCAGGAFGHRLSYRVASFLNPLGRDYVFLLASAGYAIDARLMAETVQARAMADWMARTHHTNRLVRGHQLQGSVNAVMPAGMDEINQIIAFLKTPLLAYFETHNGYEVWLHLPDGTIHTSHIAAPQSVLLKLLRLLPSLELTRGGGATHSGNRGMRPRPEIHASLDTINESLAELYLILFPEKIRTALQQTGERLVIIPDALLHYVPFCALRTVDHRYLVELYEISFWPSVTAWLLTQTSAQTRAGAPELLRSQFRYDRFTQEASALPPLPAIPKLLAFGDPTLSAALEIQLNAEEHQLWLEPLAGAKAEATAAAALFDETALLGAAATLANLLEKGNVTPIIHFATHGVFLMAAPEQSFIALADQMLSAEFLYQADRPLIVELVVMSACQTALGGDHPDSPVGLKNAFLIAGANTVVSTLWQIDDVRTIALITHFYESLKGGATIPAALRAAQVATLRDPDLQNPYYWAAFMVTGSEQNPLFGMPKAHECPRCMQATDAERVLQLLRERHSAEDTEPTTPIA